MVELAWLAIITLTAGGMGRAALRALRIAPPDRAQAWVYGLALGLGLLGFGVLLMAALHLLTPLWAVALLALAAAAGARELMRLPGDAREAWRRLRAAHVPVYAWALAGILGLHVAVNLFSSFNPPIDIDVLAYHLPLPALYIQHNAIVTRADIVYSNWPLHGEMLFLLGMLLRSDLLAQLMSFLFSLVALGAVWANARAILGARTAAAAAFIFYTIPVVGYEASIAYVDVMVAAYAMLACGALAQWRLSGQRRWLWLSALMASFAPAFKLSGGFVPALLLGAVVLLSATPRQRLANAAGFGLIASLAAMPWLLKTLVHTGNPITPYLFSLIGARDWTLSAAQQSTGMFRDFGMGRDALSLLLLPWNLTMNTTAFGGGNIGPIFLASLPLLALARAAPGVVRAALLFLAGYLAIWFAIVQQVRFLVPVLPVMSIVVAYGLVTWAGRQRMAHAAVVAALAVTGMANLGLLAANFARPPGSVPPTKSIRASLGLESRQDYYARLDTRNSFIDLMNQRLPEDSLTLLLGMSYVYTLEHDYVRGYPVEQPLFDPHGLPDAADMAAQVNHLGITHVLISRNREPATGLPHFDNRNAPPDYAATLDAFAAEYLELVEAADNFELYAVRPAGSQP